MGVLLGTGTHSSVHFSCTRRWSKLGWGQKKCPLLPKLSTLTPQVGSKPTLKGCWWDIENPLYVMNFPKTLRVIAKKGLWTPLLTSLSQFWLWSLWTVSALYSMSLPYICGPKSSQCVNLQKDSGPYFLLSSNRTDWSHQVENITTLTLKAATQ